MKPKKILIVCTGNICRSPTAEGVMRAMLADAGLEAHIEVDSAATHAYHLDAAPDTRTQRAAKKRGYDLSSLRSRKVTQDDFSRFDHVLAMDHGHMVLLRDLCPTEHQHKLAMFTHTEVPDPYYGGEGDFEMVLDMTEEGVRAWIARLAKIK